MDKNKMDQRDYQMKKISFVMVVGLCFFIVYVGLQVTKHIHNVSYSMGSISEKLSQLESRVRIEDLKK